MSSNIRKFYGQLNNILSVLGKYSHELATLHLVKSYCLTTLLYGCETLSFTEKELHKASVAWNNSFRRMFSCCWRESVKPLQYYCQSLPLSYIVSERRLLFRRQMLISDNIVLAVLSRGIVSKFVAVGSLYGISTWTLSVAKIKLLIWTTFVNSLAL